MFTFRGRVFIDMRFAYIVLGTLVARRKETPDHERRGETLQTGEAFELGSLLPNRNCKSHNRHPFREGTQDAGDRLRGLLRIGDSASLLLPRILHALRCILLPRLLARFRFRSGKPGINPIAKGKKRPKPIRSDTCSLQDDRFCFFRDAPLPDALRRKFLRQFRAEGAGRGFRAIHGIPESAR